MGLKDDFEDMANAYDAGYEAGLKAAADACTNVIKNYDVMTNAGESYAAPHIQRKAKGMVEIAREDIRALSKQEEPK